MQIFLVLISKEQNIGYQIFFYEIKQDRYIFVWYMYDLDVFLIMFVYIILFHGFSWILLFRYLDWIFPQALLSTLIFYLIKLISFTLTTIFHIILTCLKYENLMAKSRNNFIYFFNSIILMSKIDSFYL